MKNCDVFIYQDVQRNNQFDERLSAEYLSKRVYKKRICIPNVFGMGKFLFPQAVIGINCSEWKNPSGIEMQGGLFNYRDENIDKLWLGGERSAYKIVNYLNGAVYRKEYILNEFEECFEKFEEREKFWDVKIIDYIRDRYRSEQMFYEPAHPCNNILRKISEGILEILKININEICDIEEGFGCSEMPIYRCVKEALNIEFERNFIRDMFKEYKLVSTEMDLLEYCREYCYWCFCELPID